ncbi:hypothetical protein [Aquimarina longa]|uniref:hypothetical protein n=1 Tax=Aquimarina longa TaxID=1080221 RepID=UPI00078365DA|nr:hypothetical protein [Aquimarina longa]
MKNLQIHNQFSFIKRTIFISILLGILLQTIVQNVTFFTDNSYELVEVDIEEDSDEEGKEEDDNKDEKIELQVLSHYQLNFAYITECSSYQLLQPLWDFNLEIPIPPPEEA